MIRLIYTYEEEDGNVSRKVETEEDNPTEMEMTFMLIFLQVVDAVRNGLKHIPIETGEFLTKMHLAGETKTTTVTQQGELK